MPCGKASPACWRSNAAAPSCTRSSTARTRSIGNCGPRPRPLAGLASAFRSSTAGLGLGAHGLAILHGETWTAGRAGTLHRHACRPHRRSSKPARRDSADVAAAHRVRRDQRGGPGHTGRDGPDTVWHRRVRHTALPGRASTPHSFSPPPDDAWVIVELAGAEVTAVPMWDRTREVIDIRLQNAQPAAVLADAEATSAALTPGHGTRDRGGQCRRGPFRHRTNHRLHEDARAVRTTDRGVPGTEAPRRRPGHEAGGDG